MVKLPYDAVKMREQLGAELKQARVARGASLEGTGSAAKISQGYLHKLEAGRVNSPSPRVLHRLSEVLDVPYRRLMELAEYLMPDEADVPRSKGRPEEAKPMTASAQAPEATNAELLRLLEAVHAELAELKSGQQQLAQALAQVTNRGQ
jgi:transcriptional regulator with XRE-family HTH domain